MSGYRVLYITVNDGVVKIPQPKNSKYKAIKSLAEQEVLKVMLFYETKDRKPHKLITIDFDRIILDCNGVYELTDKEMEKGMYNFFHFGMTTAEEIAKSDKPLTLPISPTLPSMREKNLLYDYINKKIPNLSNDTPLVLENKIKALQNNHKEYINLIKKANRIINKKR